MGVSMDDPIDLEGFGNPQGLSQRGLELPEHIQHRFVVRHLADRIDVDVADDALPINDEQRALGKPAFAQHAIGLAHLFVIVGKQWEFQSQVLGKSFVAVAAVHADAED